MGFTKLDEGILQSSIIGETGDTFKIWIALLASCKEDGVARISPVFLSSVCKLDINIVMETLKKFMEPDIYSRTKEEDGRRIKEVDGGYFIINYHKYRDFNYSGSASAVRKRKQRESGECADLRFKPFVDRFFKFYAEEFGNSYIMQPKDGAHLKSFLKDNLDIGLDRLGRAVTNCVLDPFHRNLLSISYVVTNFSRLENMEVR